MPGLSDKKYHKNGIFLSFFNFEALYLEGWLSKRYEILLVCKKGFKICYSAKIKLISPASPEIYPEKWQKGVKSIYAKTVFVVTKMFGFWTMGVITFRTYILAPLVKKIWFLAASVIERYAFRMHKIRSENNFP